MAQNVKLGTSRGNVKQGTPTDEELELLGRKIAGDWKTLGRRLGVSDEKLQEIHHAHDQLSEKGYDMLKHWKRKNGSATATFQALNDALTHQLVQRQDLAEEFCYIHGNLSFTTRCTSATSRNSQEQDPQEEREKVNTYMKKKVYELINGTFDLTRYSGLHKLHAYLVGELFLKDVSFDKSSIKTTVTCPTLEILERLWDDYCSGHLNEVAEMCFITERVKEELNMETITLTTTILEKDYLACKLSLMPQSISDSALRTPNSAFSEKLTTVGHCDSDSSDDDVFYGARVLPKFNLHSYAIENRSKGKLLAPQFEALQSLQLFFEQHPVGRIGLVFMPSGSGHTGVISCLPYFLGKLGLKSPPEPGAAPYGKPQYKFDKPVLVIAPDLAIAAQLESVLTVSSGEPGENFLIKRGIVPPDAMYVLPCGRKIEDTRQVLLPEYLKSNDVIIANAQKFLQANWEDALPDDIFKLVIVDEAHHHPAETWRRIISKFKDHAMVVGFTATPFRGDGRRILEDEEAKIVYRLSLEEARLGRIIRRISYLVEPHDVQTEDDAFTLILERVWDIQQTKNWENPLPGNIPHMAIAITKNIPYAEQVRDMWNNRLGNPDSAIAYHSNLPKGIKMAMMQAIKDNQVKLIVVVDMLREGFDHPPISIAAIMTKIVSPVKFAQFIGRVQRIVRGREGPESAEICAHVVTHSYFQQEKNFETFEKDSLIPFTPHHLSCISP